MPEDQRKTILAITRKNKFTLDEIAEETGRTKEEEETEILKELVKTGHLSEIRLGLRKYYKNAHERRSKKSCQFLYGCEVMKIVDRKKLPKIGIMTKILAVFLGLFILSFGKRPGGHQQYGI